ncbi:uncharacterized protein ACA1_144950 [Acanthamoeba castellanii str. Neff]|uniref:Uncharacterized protein n=1 Tax=Acanthamoeba castellanii (strain ATCC 30010 / Neff) TaxID=1257118 RepID=L8GDF2_ACACF|nr:uncharacterized protein ACA1_144950 [Acanthamoeba castellanii str. Neff]ELR10894.1 hypothetical protein ACA1_144950 [Acanthamoeba castellanii str. Neff]
MRIGGGRSSTDTRCSFSRGGETRSERENRKSSSTRAWPRVTSCTTSTSWTGSRRRTAAPRRGTRGRTAIRLRRQEATTTAWAKTACRCHPRCGTAASCSSGACRLEPSSRPCHTHTHTARTVPPSRTRALCATLVILRVQKFKEKNRLNALIFTALPQVS